MTKASLTAQEDFLSDCPETIEYVIEITKSYHVNPNEIYQMTALELARVKESKEWQQHKICLGDGALSHEITVLNPKEVFPAYMKQAPVRSITSKEKTVFFNEANEPINEMAHPEHKVNYLENKQQEIEDKGFFREAWLFENLDEIGSSLESEMIDEAIIETGSIFLVENEEKQIKVDVANSLIERIYTKNGESDYVTRQKFQEATDGSTIPEYTYSEKLEKTKENVCFRKVTLIRYYEIMKNGEKIGGSEVIGSFKVAGKQSSNNNQIINHNLEMTKLNNLKKVIKDKTSIFPNPANDVVNLNWSTKKEIVNKILLIDLRGNILLEQPPTNETNTKIDISKLPSGIYFIRGLGEGGNIFVEKIIKN